MAKKKDEVYNLIQELMDFLQGAHCLQLCCELFRSSDASLLLERVGDSSSARCRTTITSCQRWPSPVGSQGA